MTIKITLTSAGSDSGPFDIYENSTGSFVLVQANVSKPLLVQGYNVTVPNGTAIVRVQSTGECTNYQDIPVQIITTTAEPTTTQPPSGCKEFISFDYKTTNDLPVRYKICGSNDWVYYTFTGLPFSGGTYITYTIDSEFPNGLCIQDGSWEYLGTEGGTPNMNNFVYGNTCTPLPALCYQIDGVWVDPDPVHPGGGTLTYVDENYQLQTITGIWEGFNQLITIRDVIYHVGVNGFNMPVSCTTTTAEPTTTAAPCDLTRYVLTSGGDTATWSFYPSCSNNNTTTITLSGNDQDSNICARETPTLISGAGSTVNTQEACGSSYHVYNSGYSTVNEGGACQDFNINGRVLFSTCIVPNIGCILYEGNPANPSPLLGYPFVYVEGYGNWDVDPTSGTIVATSFNQC